MLFFSFLQVFSLCKPCKRLKDTRDRSVGVSVRGSVDTTLTLAEYIVFKGFSDNISILGVGVAHKNNCCQK
jgi:hypothetical protein